MAELGEPGFVAIYFPHSYAFSGNVMLVPKEQVKPLSVSSTEAMKFVVSGGVSGLSNHKKTHREIGQPKNCMRWCKLKVTLCMFR